MKAAFWAALVVAALLAALKDARAEERETVPLWELGVVGGAGYLPDYPAADQNHVQGIALPFAIYRGDFLRLGDRGAARGILTDQEHLEIDIGVAGAFPVDSDDNDAREGMADLDYLIEAGPRITWRILPRSHRDDLFLALAARAVISTDVRNWRYQGISIAPSLTYWRNRLFDQDLNATLWIEPVFGLDGLNDYFYEVRPQDARPGRPAFDADDGYVGTQVSLGLSYGLNERLRLFGGVQLGYWNFAANDDSPLHRDNLTLGVGGGLRWSIYTSEKRVPR